MRLEPRVRYAAHYIRLGHYCLPRASVCLDDEGRLELKAFEAEEERTIFVSGTIFLRPDPLPRDWAQQEASPAQEVSLEELGALLQGSSSWQVDLSATY